MNDPRNELAAWMKFYDDQKIGGAAPAITGWDGQARDANYSGGRMAWARSMMQGQGQQQPDFFSGMNQLAPYVQPQQFNGQMPQRQPTRDPMRAPTQNYLTQLMGGR